MVDGEREGDRAAERVADYEGPLDAELVHQDRHEPRLRFQRRRGGRLRIACPGSVDDDQPVRGAQALGQRVGEALQLLGEAVDHDDRRSRAFVEIVQAHAVHGREPADPRHHVFGFAGGKPSKDHQARDDREDEAESDQKDDEQGRHDFDSALVSSGTTVKRSPTRP